MDFKCSENVRKIFGSVRKTCSKVIFRSFYGFFKFSENLRKSSEMFGKSSEVFGNLLKISAPDRKCS